MEPDVRTRIQVALSRLPVRTLNHPILGEAGVLIPILERSGEPQLVLTKRTESVSTHKGQISFPGGIREDGDGSLLDTALREAEEEVGLRPGKVEILGRFHDYLSVTQLRVVPYVGFLGKAPALKPNPREVDRVFLVPLRFFCGQEPRCEERSKFGRVGSVYFYDYGDESIWGLTAAIIRDFVRFLAEAGVG